MLRKKKRGNIKIPQSSVVLDLAPILAARNIRTPYAYLVKMGINTVTAQKMLKGVSVQVNYDQLTKLCLNLNCTPNDIFGLRDMTLPENHALNKLATIDQEPIATIDEWLAGKSIEEIQELMKK